EELEAENNPEDPTAGTRKVPFSREIYIERDDFCENPPPKYFRLSPGKEIRLKHAYFIRCEEVVKDASGNVTELRCTYDPRSRGGQSPDGRKVLGTSHWVSARHAIPAQVRLYGHLFTVPDPGAAEDFKAVLNPESLTVLAGALAEPSLAAASAGTRYQFLRQGYFCVDPDSRPGVPVFNQTVSLKDTWARLAKDKV
ncbi:MAG: glutamine--tRNA ligase, partial [Cyanobacteria bacterium REEB65]|nr:glutamine--tRNA ligase [Cyanobacteria bacterium REEB65]